MYSVVSKFAGFVFVLANAFAAPAPAPRFETIMSGPINIGNLSLIAGPFGSRLNAPVLSGNLSDTSGNLVATVVPNTSGDDGVVSATGTFFPDAKATLQWIVDGELAYLHLQGVGELGVSDLTYVHLETDSQTWSSLNSRFLLANLTFGTPSPILTIFGSI